MWNPSGVEVFIVILVSVGIISTTLMKLFRPQPEPIDPILESLSKGICPDCGGKKFWGGPHGGMGQNIICSNCKSSFNCAPMEDCNWLGSPFIAERINTGEGTTTCDPKTVKKPR